MRDYKLGKIYKLHILGNDDLVYYGSTIQSLSMRLAGHRRKFKRWKNGKSSNYITSFKLFENGEVVITLVEKYACSCKYELLAKERFYIENNKCVNKCIPTRTQKEWCEANANKIKEFRKENANKHKEYMKEYQKTDKHKQYMKEYQKTDKYKQYMKEYQKTDKRKQYLKQKIKCEFCGCSVIKNNLKRHHKSIKCKKFQ